MEKKTTVTEEDYSKLFEAFGQLPKTNIWSQVEREDFTTKRFELGNVNNILCCELTDDARKRLCKSLLDFSGIVVKLPSKDPFMTTDPFEMVIINTMLSDHGIGPRLIFASQDVYINEYLKGRNYNYDDDCDENTVKEMAKVMAKLHYLNPPISKKGFDYKESMRTGYIEEPWAKQVLNKEYMPIVEKYPELMEKFGPMLSELDLLSEFNRINELTPKTNSPAVLSHTDLNRGNRIVQKTVDKDGKTSSRIYLLDFDYTAYNYRGYDLGRYFSNYRHKDDMWGDEGFPSDQEMELFLEAYRQECAKIVGPYYLKQEINSVQQLISETKIYALDSYLTDYFFGVYMVLFGDQSAQKVEYFLNVTQSRRNGYQRLLKQFTDDGTIGNL